MCVWMSIKWKTAQPVQQQQQFKCLFVSVCDGEREREDGQCWCSAVHQLVQHQERQQHLPPFSRCCSIDQQHAASFPVATHTSPGQEATPPPYGAVLDHQPHRFPTVERFDFATLVVHRTFFPHRHRFVFFLFIFGECALKTIFLLGNLCIGWIYRGSIAQWKCCKTCGSKHT